MARKPTRNNGLARKLKGLFLTRLLGWSDIVKTINGDFCGNQLIHMIWGFVASVYLSL